MSDKTRDLTLERLNRLTQAVADLGENQTAQGRMLMRLLGQMSGHLGAIRSELATLNGTVRDLASEQVLLGNRVENSFTRALRTNIRRYEIEDGRYDKK